MATKATPLADALAEVLARLAAEVARHRAQFEARVEDVQRSVTRLGLPSEEEVATLTARVAALEDRLRALAVKLSAAPAPPHDAPPDT
jgi:hypothetical protein